MTWEWSHTNEAYAAVRENLERLPLTDLACIASEWYAWGGGGEDDFDSDKYNARYSELLAEIERGVLASDILADWIYDKASEQSSCSNGGWDAYVCPFHCHSVAFHTESEVRS